MESSISEQEIIQHIKFITKDLLEPKNKKKNKEWNTISPVKTFYHGNGHNGSGSPSSEYQYEDYRQVKNRIRNINYGSEERGRKRKPIFAAVSAFWDNYRS